MLEIQGLRRSYGDVVALDGADLEVARGEVVGLLGPNGAGKTTLVSIVAGLRRPDAGTVRVGGLDALSRSPQVRRLIGLAPQELGVYPIVTVRHNLVLFGELAGLRGRELTTRIDEVSEALDIADLLERLTGTLSGGQKRRVHTAIALLHRPPLLLLDEATAGADVQTRTQLLQLVRRLAADGSAVLYSTHYLAEIEELGASVAILERGRVIARGPVRDLVARHGTAHVELTFDGPAGALAVPEAQADGSVVRIPSRDAAATAAAVLAVLGEDARRLRSLEIVLPSLEAV